MTSHGRPIPLVSESHGSLELDIRKSSKMMRDSGSCWCVQVEEGKRDCGLKIEPFVFFPPRKYLGMGLAFQTQQGWSGRF